MLLMENTCCSGQKYCHRRSCSSLIKREVLGTVTVEVKDQLYWLTFHYPFDLVLD